MLVPAAAAPRNPRARTQPGVIGRGGGREEEDEGSASRQGTELETQYGTRILV